MKKKKAVTQEHAMGCAVACTAYILDCSYQNALKLYENPHHAWGKGFYCPEIIAALNKAGIHYQYSRVKSSRDKQLKIPGTIVFIEKSAKYPVGHFLVRTEDGFWMDPWINLPLISPTRSGFQKKLPGMATYIVFSSP